MEGEDAQGVISAVEMLRNIDGNPLLILQEKLSSAAAMSLWTVPVRRSGWAQARWYPLTPQTPEDRRLTALPEEVEGAIAEGRALQPESTREVEADGWKCGGPVGAAADNRAIDAWGRPSSTSDVELKRIPCDIVIVAVEQGKLNPGISRFGVPVH